MRVPTLDSAREYVAAADLPAPPRQGLEPLEAVSLAFDQAKAQATVVGSDVISFVRGVTPEKRRAVVSASLLAQLVAKKRVADPRQIYDWYDAYLDVLSNIGWSIQDRGFAEYHEERQGFEAHEAILQVATTVLGPAPAALAVVKATLDALKSMSADSPWITVFNRESQHANAARFQVSLVEEDSDEQFMVALMAFGLEARATVTQVLFFKLRSTEAKLRHLSGRVTIDSHILAGVQDDVERKVAAFQRDYIRNLPDL